MAAKKTVKEMKDNLLTRGKDECCKPGMNASPCFGAFYFLGALGAAIHYLSLATGFWMGVLGILKALIWPLFVVLKILGL